MLDAGIDTRCKIRPVAAQAGKGVLAGCAVLPPHPDIISLRLL
jgi:hypothetical protein